MESSDFTCNMLAKILNGTPSFENDTCTVTIHRDNIQATIGNRPFLSLNHQIHFGPPDNSGNSLITAELVLHEGEVPNMVEALSSTGIMVSAVHNNWIVDNPRLMYVNAIAVSNSVVFANHLARILNTITGHRL